MKEKLYFLVFLSAFALRSAAQNIAVGFRSGISIPNLTAGSGNKNPLNTGYGSRLGPDLALLAEFPISDVFAIRPMLEYSAQGGKKDGLQAFTTPDELRAMFPVGQAPDYLYANYKSEVKLNYLLLPVLAKAAWPIKRSPVQLFISAGPFVGLLVSARQVSSGRSQFFLNQDGQQALPGGEQSFDDDSKISSSLHQLNAGIEGNVGVSYQVGSASVFLEGGGNYGFFNIQKNAIDGKNQTGAAIATIGYSYRLAKAAKW